MYKALHGSPIIACYWHSGALGSQGLKTSPGDPLMQNMPLGFFCNLSEWGLRGFTGVWEAFDFGDSGFMTIGYHLYSLPLFFFLSFCLSFFLSFFLSFSLSLSVSCSFRTTCDALVRAVSVEFAVLEAK